MKKLTIFLVLFFTFASTAHSQNKASIAFKTPIDSLYFWYSEAQFKQNVDDALTSIKNGSSRNKLDSSFARAYVLDPASNKFVEYTNYTTSGDTKPQPDAILIAKLRNKIDQKNPIEVVQVILCDLRTVQPAIAMAN